MKKKGILISLLLTLAIVFSIGEVSFAENEFVTEDGITYYYEDGVMATGFKTINGLTYYFRESGSMVTGWQNIDNEWRFFRKSGTLVTGLQYIDNNWYLFGEMGIKQTGWQNVKGKMQYFQNNGRRLSGWLHNSNASYYLGKDGNMYTGTKVINGLIYGFRNSGTLIKDSLAFLDGGWRYFRSTGTMVTGWQHIKGEWYFFRKSGSVATNFQKIGKYWYYLGDGGVKVSGWQYIDGHWYFFRLHNGSMVTGNQFIDGTWHKFDSSGKHISGIVKNIPIIGLSDGIPLGVTSQMFVTKSYQESAESRFNNLRNSFNYTFTNPLMVYNPYGFSTNGIVFHFRDSSITNISYTIKSPGTVDFIRTAKIHNSNGSNFQIVGFVPGRENNITITATHSDGTTNSISQKIFMPENNSGFPVEITDKKVDDYSKLTDGLYVMVGLPKTNQSHHLMFDKYGVMRFEIYGNKYNSARIVNYKDDILLTVDKQLIIRMDNLGKVVWTYKMPKDIYMHHDFNIDYKSNTLISLVDNLAGNTIEDHVIAIDLDSGQTKALIDFREVMKEYFDHTHGSESYRGGFLWDWIHFNSVDILDEGSIILSAREQSAIIKLDNIYVDPTIDYIIAEPKIFQGMSYESKLLKPVNVFNFQAGQHSLQYEENGNPNDGIYYISLFNNNYWSVLTREAIVNSPIDGTFDFVAPNGVSYFYRYEVNENDRTVKLLNSRALPYSAIVSSVQVQDNGNIVTMSGRSLALREFDKNLNEVGAFNYPYDQLIYRTLKYDFNGFFFE